MSPTVKCASITAVLVCATIAMSQVRTGRGTVITPESSVERPADIGIRAHTNVKLFIPEGGLPQTAAQPLTVGPPYSGYFYETPASLACVYSLASPRVTGCDPNKTTANPSGGSKAIAVVDAYHDPTAASDLDKFSKQFGLPAADITVVFAQGKKPPLDPTGGWELEESLDIEWSHAIAPYAKIFLVEAGSDSFSNLFPAVDKAAELVKEAGGGVVSMSWGSPEFFGETSYDSHFLPESHPGVTFFASTGDSPGTTYPSTSPDVVAVGGTTLSRNPFAGNFELESTWDLGGGGKSLYERRPAYQNPLADLLGDYRGVPDLSADANPQTGAWVYDSNEVDGQEGWIIVGGTSFPAPVWAGIVNLAGNLPPSSEALLMMLYSDPADDFHDVTHGVCGPYEGYLAEPGYDLCTGLGSPNGLLGK